MKNHITDVDCETGTHICGTNFSLTGTEGSAFLTVRFPSDGTSGAEDYGTAHAAEFEQR